jgi:hypothetical protein
MKTLIIYPALILILFCIFPLTLTTGAAGDSKNPALIIFKIGESTIKRGKTEIPAKKNMLLKEKDQIRVKSGFLHIQVGHSTVCRLIKGTKLTLNKTFLKGESEDNSIFLEKGSLFLKIKKENKKKKYKLDVTTVTTVAAVRGTNFAVESKPELTDILVDAGVVEVKGRKINKSQTCSAGNAVSVTKDDLIQSVLTPAQKKKLEIFKEFDIMKKIIFDAIIEQRKKNEEMMKGIKKGK